MTLFPTLNMEKLLSLFSLHLIFSLIIPRYLSSSADGNDSIDEAEWGIQLYWRHLVVWEGRSIVPKTMLVCEGRESRCGGYTNLR